MNILFLDTCSLMRCNEEIFNDAENLVVISSITLNELEDIKTSTKKDEETKYNARQALKLLEKYNDKFKIIVYKRSWDLKIFWRNLPKTNDSKILISALQEKKKAKKNLFLFFTEDRSCKEIALSLGLNVTSIREDEIEDYTGFREIYLSEPQLAEFYSDTVFNGKNKYNLLVNQYLIIRDLTTKEVVDKYKWTDEGYQRVHYIKTDSKMFGKISPLDGDIYQHIALDSLYSNQITMIEGPAGSGKSYLSFAYMFDLLEHNKIDKIIIFCNTVATKGSAKLGFYPGSRDEKLLDSQIGNLLVSKLGDRMIVDDLISSGKLILLPMSDIRGYDTSGMRAAVYISEAQNLDIELMRLALQRIGEDSVCIIDGDSQTQVDMAQYAGTNNGMRRVSKVFRGTDLFGTVRLQTVKRSRIAEIAQNM